MARDAERTPGEFVGRTHELGLAETACRAAADGRCSLVVVSGNAGIGKSGREAVGLLTSDASQGPVDLDRLARFAAVADRLAEACRRDPVCLVSDDVHAADAGALLLVRFVARSLARPPLALVLSRRRHEPEGGIEANLLDEVAAGLGEPDGVDVSGLLVPVPDTGALYERAYRSVLPAALNSASRPRSAATRSSPRWPRSRTTTTGWRCSPQSSPAGPANPPEREAGTWGKRGRRRCESVRSPHVERADEAAHDVSWGVMYQPSPPMGRPLVMRGRYWSKNSREVSSARLRTSSLA
jgi:hypothetical protein